MKSLNKVLQRYVEGNEEERLSLYMGYRELREDFQAIETQERVPLTAVSGKEKPAVDGIPLSQRILSQILIYLSSASAHLSLILFLIFLYRGPYDLINFRFDGLSLLIFNTALSFAFFIQHSSMVRKSFRDLQARYLNRTFHSALFSFISGLFLLSVVLLWQRSPGMIFSPPESIMITMRILFFLTLVFLAWGIRKLGLINLFGTKEIRLYLKGKALRPIPFTIEGPYRYVRHPLYFFVLLLIWVYPYLTPDRLLFNILWTAWIVTGTRLEEKDLIEHFWEQYRDYRKRVPMLFPLPGKRG